MTGAGASCSGSPAAHTWSSALSYCEALSLASPSDGRLPNVVELMTILQNAVTPPYAEFYNTPAGNLWTSTTSGADASRAWMVNFNSGQSSNVNSAAKSTPASVRCVRGP